MDDKLRIDRQDGWIDIVLDDPAHGNRISNDMGSALADVLHSVGADVRLVRLRGEGASFCGGRASPAIDRRTATAQEFRTVTAEPPLRLYAAMVECKAPVLGVIQGEAVGVGCALAALCDVSITHESAVFRVPEMDRSVPPTLVMTALAGRLTHQAIADLVLSRESVGAERAQAMGLVSRVVPDGEFQEASERLLSSLLACDADGAQAVKEFLRNGLAMPRAERAAYASCLLPLVLSSRDRT